MPEIRAKFLELGSNLKTVKQRAISSSDVNLNLIIHETENDFQIDSNYSEAIKEVHGSLYEFIKRTYYKKAYSFRHTNNVNGLRSWLKSVNQLNLR
jgi:hypothetical protein